MSEHTLSDADLRHFTGTVNYYRHPLARNVLYTDGAQHVAEHGGAYWLIGYIASMQRDRTVSAEHFQHWRLIVNADNTAVLTCDDGNDNIVHAHELLFTDFPLPEISFYCVFDGDEVRVIMLPSEY